MTARTSTSSVADGVVALMSLARRRVPRDRRRCPAPRHDLLTGRYAWYDVYPLRGRQVARGRARSSRSSSPTSAASSAASSGSATSTTTTCRTPMRADFRSRVRDPRPRRRGSPSSGPPTRAWHPCTRSRARRRPPLRGATRLRRRAQRRARHLPSSRAGSSRAWTATSRRPRCATSPSPTPGELLGAAGYTTEEIDELTEKGVVA